MLRIEILRSRFAERTAELLTPSGEPDLFAAEVVDRPGLAALIVSATPDVAADVVLDAVAEAAGRLIRERVLPFAKVVAGQSRPPSPKAVLRDHDPAHPVSAERLLHRLRTALREFDDGSWTYDHIGSTSVPDLRAKPFVDLQLGVRPLPGEGSAVDEALHALGFVPARGARPDSPGVYRDQIKDPALAPEDDYRKRLYVRADPGLPAILHVRKLGSPWWSYSVLFRDWLRTDTAGRRAYEAAKERAAAAHADDPDYDDYTRTKAAFFAKVQRDYERAGADSAYRLR
ncbi:GrpB family protein [Amycolatopsis samaneae]|uniref:GrpB family protein n=1 Tax=Amycolatopsis samaneae TaxID=664691 RepID=UPI003617FA74